MCVVLVCAVRMLSSGWGTRCWISLQWWIRIFLISEWSWCRVSFEGHTVKSVRFSEPKICHWTLLVCLLCQWLIDFDFVCVCVCLHRYSLKPNDQILAEEKHKALWVTSSVYINIWSILNEWTFLSKDPKSIQSWLFLNFI